MASQDSCNNVKRRYTYTYMNQGYLFMVIERVNCWNEEDIEVYVSFLASSNFLSSRIKPHLHYRKIESGTGLGKKVTQIKLFFIF